MTSSTAKVRRWCPVPGASEVVAAADYDALTAALAERDALIRKLIPWAEGYASCIGSYKGYDVVREARALLTRA